MTRQTGTAEQGTTNGAGAGKTTEENIGKGVSRIDARLKVTGAAEYAAEFKLPRLAYAALVQSSISRGRILDIDTSAATSLPGVLDVITYKNAPKLQPIKDEPGGAREGKFGEKRLIPLQSDRIYYDGQHIGLVVAETRDQALYAASLVKVRYQSERPIATIEQGMAHPIQPASRNGEGAQEQRGNINNGLDQADVRIQQTYSTPIQHHNPMEPHATIAAWNGDELTLYESTQSVVATKQIVAEMLGIKADNVHVITRFVGGGFGCKGFVWPRTVLAAVAAKRVGRPVQLEITRHQMFTSNGHRSQTIQHMTLGAKQDGTITAIRHVTQAHTSMVDEFLEPAGINTSRTLYASPTLDMRHYLAPINIGTPTPMRAPGETPGMYALECAMDELAVALKMDPIELRLRNHADVSPHSGKPWSSKHLKECYTQGADLFGWSRRNPQPRTMREGNILIGYGMATATYPAGKSPASAKARIYADGHAVASSATQDIGTGTYTIMAQIAADGLGLPLENVQFALGDTNLPPAPGSGGSKTAASVGPVVYAAATATRAKVIALAIADKQSPLNGHSADEIFVNNGRLFVMGTPTKFDTYVDLLARNNLPYIDGEASSKPPTKTSSRFPYSQDCGDFMGSCRLQEKDQPYEFQSFGAQFAEVRVDMNLGTIRVTRFVSVMDVGTVLNAKTGNNQIVGGIVMGIGMALMEQTWLDERWERYVNHDLAEYHVPVNADIPAIQVKFIGEPDIIFNSFGARGMGEIGITGTAAAVANAIYNATGKRVRDLPITLDKLS